MVGSERFLQISAPQLLRLGIDSVLKILNERITNSINQYINYKGGCKTAPPTQGLLTNL